MKFANIAKYARVLLSGLMLALVTMAIVGVPTSIAVLAEWSVKLQLINATLTLSLGVFIAWIIITLIFGRVYCSTVCPIGTLQDIIARLRPKRVYRYTRPLNPLRIAVIAVVIITAAAGFMVILELLDPMEEYRRMVENIIDPHLWGAIIAGVTLLVIIVMAWKGGRLFCNTICPIGSAFGMVSRTSLMHVEIDPDKCIRCRKCSDVCKATCIDIDTTTVDFSRCVMCMNCLPVCPNDAIKYRPDRKQLSTPMFQKVEKQGAQPTAMNK